MSVGGKDKKRGDIVASPRSAKQIREEISAELRQVKLTKELKMTQAVKKLKQEEKKIVLAYAQLKLKSNRLNKELDTMKQNVVDVFERTNQNLIIVQDENDQSFGLQKITRKRKKFETANFKQLHNDLFNKFCTEIVYNEYKAIGDNNDK